MRGKQIIITTVFVLGVMLAVALNVIAAPPVFYGVFVGYRGNTLTVMDKQGQKETYSVTKETMVANSEGSNQRLERLRSGTRMSVTAQDDKATQIVIKEVPK